MRSEEAIVEAGHSQRLPCSPSGAVYDAGRTTPLLVRDIERVDCARQMFHKKTLRV
jgi:hypothetical protein